MRRSLSNSQVRELLEAVDLRSPFGQRDHLLIMFLYQTGLRVSELSRLLIVHVAQGGRPRQQLDLPAALCKGPRGRLVPLNATAQACIEKQLRFNESRGLSLSPGAPLFQNRKQCPLSPRTIQYLVKSYREKAGLDVAATPHTLRHTHASQLVSSGARLTSVQCLLGHRDLRSTQVFTWSNPKDLKNDSSLLGG